MFDCDRNVSIWPSEVGSLLIWCNRHFVDGLFVQFIEGAIVTSESKNETEHKE